MPKKIKEYGYLLAYNIIKGLDKISTIESSTLTNKNKKDDDEIILPSNIINPEKLFIKKEGFDSLSQEAKEIINTIINMPEETLDLFRTEKKMIISKTIFQKVFEESWKSEFIVQKTFDEIKKWIETIE